MVEISELLQIMFYLFGIALFIVMIILGVKVIQLLDRAEEVLSNVEDKVNTLNGIFSVINKATTSIDLIGSKIVGSVVGVVDKIFKKKKEDNEYE